MSNQRLKGAQSREFLDPIEGPLHPGIIRVGLIGDRKMPALVRPEAFEIVRRLGRQALTCPHQEIGFEVVVAKVSSGEVGRPTEQRSAPGGMKGKQFGVKLLAVRIVPSHLDSTLPRPGLPILTSATAHELPSHLPVGNSALLAPERIFVGIEQKPHRSTGVPAPEEWVARPI